jgi:hypothetical protein
LKRALVLTLICTILSSVPSNSQTKRKSSTQKKSAPSSTSFEEKKLAEIRAGREQIATQIKALTQFLYLFGNISKGIETAEMVNKNNEQTSVGMSAERIAQSKAKLRDSIKNVRIALDQLESGFRLNPVLQAYYPKLAGVAKLGQTAESQAAVGTFDQSGKSLLAAVNKLTDALVALG